jgi:molybdopterin molybdotransferase
MNAVLSQDISSPLNLPNHDNSDMDGYAFALEIFHQSKTLTLVDRSIAGASYKGKCKLGECLRIMIGAKITGKSLKFMRYI